MVYRKNQYWCKKVFVKMVQVMIILLAKLKTSFIFLDVWILMVKIPFRNAPKQANKEEDVKLISQLNIDKWIT